MNRLPRRESITMIKSELLQALCRLFWSQRLQEYHNKRVGFPDRSRQSRACEARAGRLCLRLPCTSEDLGNGYGLREVSCIYTVLLVFAI